MIIKVQLYSDDGVLISQHVAPFIQGLHWKTDQPVIDNKVICWGFEVIPEYEILKEENSDYPTMEYEEID